MFKSSTLIQALIAFLLIAAGTVAFTMLALAQDVSREAQRHALRGEAAMEMAKSKADYREAVREFTKATQLEPNWAAAWYNLGVVQDKAGDFGAAMNSFRKYVALRPDASDRAEVEALIIKLEYKQERAEKNRRENSAEAQRARFLEGLSGEWRKFHRGEDSTVGAIIRINGTSFELREVGFFRGGTLIHGIGQAHTFRGIIQGSTITGTVDIDFTMYTNGRVLSGGFKGRISGNGKSLVLNYDAIVPSLVTGMTIKSWNRWTKVEAEFRKER